MGSAVDERLLTEWLAPAYQVPDDWDPTLVIFEGLCWGAGTYVFPYPLQVDVDRPLRLETERLESGIWRLRVWVGGPK
jgi:hypothetical protein